MNIFEAFSKLKAEGGYVTRDKERFYYVSESGLIYHHNIKFAMTEQDSELRNADILSTDWQHVTELPTTN